MRETTRTALRLSAAVVVLLALSATAFGSAETETAADERLTISLISFTPRGAPRPICR